jgi:hypothetical protein
MTYTSTYLSPNPLNIYGKTGLEDRCTPRKMVRIPATLRSSGAKGFPIIVTDISIAGFGCEAVSSMHPRDLCWLTLPGLTGLQAEIIWNNGITVGCAFSNLMNEAVLRNVLSRCGY